MSFFRALNSRNYAIFFIGQTISLIGTWIGSVALSWMVYRLTKDPIFLGLNQFLGQIPALILSPIAGVHVDRWNKRKVVIVTQATFLFHSIILVALFYNNSMSVSIILLMSLLHGIIVAFDIPARQAITSMLVKDKSDLSNAIALNSALFNGARLIGPAIGGILIAHYTEGVCFIIDTLSFFAVLISLFLLSNIDKKEPPLKDKQSVINELFDGYKYLCSEPSLYKPIIFVGIISITSISHIVLLPIYADQILGGGPKLLGLLTSLSGLGAMFGALYLARSKNNDLDKTIKLSGLALGVSMMSMGLFPYTWIVMISICLIGFFLIMLVAAVNIGVQSHVFDNMRGRVMSYFVMAFSGMMPVGGILSGSLAWFLGTPITILIAGIIIIFASYRYQSGKFKLN